MDLATIEMPVQEARKKFLEIQDRYPGTKLSEQAVRRLRRLP